MKWRLELANPLSHKPDSKREGIRFSRAHTLGILLTVSNYYDEISVPFASSDAGGNANMSTRAAQLEFHIRVTRLKCEGNVGT